MATAIVDPIRSHYPDAKITWVIKASALPAVAGLAGVDEFLVWDDTHGQLWRHVSLLITLTKVWLAGHDVALDLHGARGAARFLRFSRALRRITGSSSDPSALRSANEVILDHGEDHELDYFRRRAGALIPTVKLQESYPRLPLNDSHRDSTRKFLSARGWRGNPLVVFNLGASNARKVWPAEHFVRLGAAVLSEVPGCRIVLTGSGREYRLKEHFVEALSHLDNAPCKLLQESLIDGVGVLNLMEVAALAELCTAFVTGDTGPMHVAAAAGAPTVGLFGPTQVHRFRPIQQPGKPLCFALNAVDKFGLRDCLNALEPEEVFRTLKPLLVEEEIEGASAGTGRIAHSIYD